MTDKAAQQKQEELQRIPRELGGTYTSPYFVDSYGNEYESYAMAWRYLGMYMDCSSSSRRQLRTLSWYDSYYKKSKTCYPKILWAAVRHDIDSKNEATRIERFHLARRCFLLNSYRSHVVLGVCSIMIPTTAVARSENTSITTGPPIRGTSPPAKTAVAPRWTATPPIPRGNSSASTRSRSNSIRIRSLNNCSSMKDIACGMETKRRRRRIRRRRRRRRHHHPTATTPLCKACAAKCPMVAPSCKTCPPTVAATTMWASNPCPEVRFVEWLCLSCCMVVDVPWMILLTCYCLPVHHIRQHDTWYLHRFVLPKRIGIFVPRLPKVHFRHHVVQRSL
jgi:hypothetical protein